MGSAADAIVGAEAYSPMTRRTTKEIPTKNFVIFFIVKSSLFMIYRVIPKIEHDI